MEKNIFITGGLGFLGSYLVRELLKEKDNLLILLVRDKDGQPIKKRIDSLVNKFYKRDFKEIIKRIKVVKGDITQHHLGIDKTKRNSLIKKIDTIYHCAALCNFTDSLKIMRKVNVEGTRNLLDFAMECRSFGCLRDVNHISTLGVAGKSKGVFYEDMLDEGQEFNNAYEQSKFEAEKIAEVYKKKENLPLTIFRPSVIVGDSITGEVNNFQMFYQFLHILSLDLFKELPVNRYVQYGLDPVDCVAKATACLSSNGPSNKTYHLVNPNIISFDFFLDVAADYFGFRRPALVSENNYNYDKLSGFRRRLLNFYLPYLIHKKILFDTKNFDSAMSGEGFSWPKIDERFLIRLFSYCDKVGYIKRKVRRGHKLRSSVT